MKLTSWSSGLSVSGDGTGVVAHAGSVGLRQLVDRTGLTEALSTALRRRGFVPGHDRGRVVTDVAVLLADGGEAISDIDVLRHQSAVLGPVASAPTVWRALDELESASLAKIEKARAGVRRHVWSLIEARHGQIPSSAVADRDLGDTVVLDVDATLVTAHSEKEQAAPTYKRGFGFHPIGVWCDNTTELLAITLRPGNAGANHAGDHIDLLGRAITQIPAGHRHRVLVRTDSAGGTHDLLDWLTDQDRKRRRGGHGTVEYSIGFPINNTVHDAIDHVPEMAWMPAIDSEGVPRDPADEAGVVELTGLLELPTWPDGMRVIVRRERPHPGARLTIFEAADGYRYQAFVTNTRTGQPNSQLAYLEARHRAHARVEDRIRHAKDCGLGRYPSREFKINQAWTQIVAISADLVAWLRHLVLDGELADAEPKALRYRLLHVPARLTRSARRRRLRFPVDWPWTKPIVAAFTRIGMLQALT